ncbi:prepilin-type N-terminal cleavage/methylation domain-containing protein [Crassaminicella indica]|uniref:Prepilin-type N-terminal cleavage/methylation domain-containing protein n=1 Tax=Crassaminicella indica TaxID=2855394 RepID=A0ABX8RCH5_9CLOT|nr:prepilin-type N-terminal cleavage/methylation domain-containing protein [Crassaminicella indica]QXM06007.1 prepilin-type N-terminal cleavage/methylation domain-containing protein [Crassaminicella indica]
MKNFTFKKRKSLNNKTNGFTLIEILLVLSIISILSLISISINNSLYHKMLLETTANKIKSALLLAQQLSIAETNSYCFEFINSTNTIRVREAFVGGKIIFKEKISNQLSIQPFYFDDVTYNSEGNTSYHKFYLVNKNNKKIQIETMVGTGKIKISKIY